MARLSKALAWGLVAGSLLGVAGCLVTKDSFDKKVAELEMAQAQLEQASDQLAGANAALATTKTELANTHQALKQAQDELVKTQTESAGTAKQWQEQVVVVQKQFRRQQEDFVAASKKLQGQAKEAAVAEQETQLLRAQVVDMQAKEQRLNELVDALREKVHLLQVRIEQLSKPRPVQ